MSKHEEWSETAPSIIYEAYPEHDLLPIEPPRPGETIANFKVRAEDAGDTLFLFLCREADDELDAHEYTARLGRAIQDIGAVQEAFLESLRSAASDSALHSVAQSAKSATERRDLTIRLALDADWIELSMTYADARGRRSGNVSSSLHTTEKDAEAFNVAMDAVESIVLAHACAGVDVTDPRYVEGIRTCVEACGNNL